MRIETTDKYIILHAENGNVLCDGYSATSANGKVTAPINADVSAWAEMTESEAEQLIIANTEPEEPMTETEEKAAAYDILMGVN